MYHTDAMRIIHAVSTSIAAMRYDDDARTLEVDFPVRKVEGAVTTYTYRNVSADIVTLLEHEAGKAGGSVGSLFSLLVRSKAQKISEFLFTL